MMVAPVVNRRTFHGPVSPQGMADALIAEFSRGTMRAQQIGQDDHIEVQIASRPGPASGGPTALTVQLQSVEDGVLVQFGQQAWFGVAASLAQTGLWALKNPWTLISRLDDLAEDLASIGLADRVWSVLTRTAEGAGASHEISERLRRVTCAYCSSANPVGEAACLACGAPLGPAQPSGCPNCGFVAPAEATVCPQCGHRLPPD
jgi:DNA-directed RNA polymerase subunit RPC12/RpoP